MNTRFYYNIQIGPNLTDIIPANFEEVRNDTILDNIENYRMAITRFEIPFGNLPLVIFRIQEGLVQSDRNLGVYSTLLEYGGSDFQDYLIYVPNKINITLPNPPSLNGGHQDINQEGYYFIYDFSQMVNLINTSFEQNHNDMIAAFPIPDFGIAPFLLYDPISQLFSLIVDYKYIIEGVKIFINDSLNRFLNGFDYINDDFTNNKEFQFRIYDTGLWDNGYPIQPTIGALPEFVRVKQNVSNIAMWGEIKKIIFKTSLLPIRNEYKNSGIKGQPGANIQSPILTDFLIDNWKGQRENIIFIEDGEYRYIDFVANGPLRKISVQLFWEDTEFVERPLSLISGREVNIKIMFALIGT